MVAGGHVEETRELLPELLRTGRITPDGEMLEVAIDTENIEIVKLLWQFGYHSQRAYMRAISRSNLNLADLLNGDPDEMSGGQRPLHLYGHPLLRVLNISLTKVPTKPCQSRTAEVRSTL
jgi:hypothetical protein